MDFGGIYVVDGGNRTVEMFCIRYGLVRLWIGNIFFECELAKSWHGDVRKQKLVVDVYGWEGCQAFSLTGN